MVMRLANNAICCCIFTANGSLLLEEKVLNAVKRMRCSRRSGVIFNSYDNGCFAAYTSSVSSRCPASPLGGSLLVGALSNCRQLLRGFPRSAIIPWHADVIGAGWRS